MSTASWFGQALLPWYRQHHRPLPWRQAPHAYHIWLSEVILQQTRVDQGLAYWHRFVERYPTVAQLAAASEDEVLRLWQGLGYYSRARNLLAAARQVVQEHGGLFPADHGALRDLKGVGDYTAAAISSIAFGIPEPVVDGNVYRVLARVFGVHTPIDSTAGRLEFKELAAKLLDHGAPGDHNQAVMELGALVCTPRNPRCTSCPLTDRCVARAQGLVEALPVKAGRTTVRERHFNYLHMEVDGGLFLRKRMGKDIWQGLWELPLIETVRPMDKRGMAALIRRELGAGHRLMSMDGPVRHVLSHQVIHARFWVVIPPRGTTPVEGSQWVSWEQLDAHALPRLLDRWLADRRS